MPHNSFRKLDGAKEKAAARSVRMLALLIGPLDVGRLPGESGSGTKFADSC